MIFMLVSLLYSKHPPPCMFSVMLSAPFQPAGSTAVSLSQFEAIINGNSQLLPFRDSPSVDCSALVSSAVFSDSVSEGGVCLVLCAWNSYLSSLNFLFLNNSFTF